MMANTGDRSLQRRTGLKKGLKSPSLLLSTRSRDWKRVAEPSHWSEQDQRSNATLELDAKSPGHVWITYVVLQGICGNGSEHCKTGHPFKHLQDHCPFEANRQLIEQGFHVGIAGKQVMYWVSKKCFSVCLGFFVCFLGFFCMFVCFCFPPGSTVCLFLTDLLKMQLFSIKGF